MIVTHHYGELQIGTSGQIRTRSFNLPATCVVVPFKNGAYSEMWRSLGWKMRSLLYVAVWTQVVEPSLLKTSGMSHSRKVRLLPTTLACSNSCSGMPMGERGCQTRLLHSQLQEGLRYELMKAPAVSGSHTYCELCLAARNEEKRVAELTK